jgi:hypothetical protein
MWLLTSSRYSCTASAVSAHIEIAVALSESPEETVLAKRDIILVLRVGVKCPKLDFQLYAESMSAYSRIVLVLRGVDRTSLRVFIYSFSSYIDIYPVD